MKSFVCWIFVLHNFISRCLNLLHQRVCAHAGTDVPVKCKGFSVKRREEELNMADSVNLNLIIKILCITAAKRFQLQRFSQKQPCKVGNLISSKA